MRRHDLVRLYAFLVLLSGLMIVVVVVGGNGGTSARGEPVPQSLAVDRIAYTGPDGQIRTVAPDGSDEQRISPDEGFFTWPTWSPDGRRLAFSGVTGGGEEPRVSLYAFNTVNGQLRELHVRESGIRGIVAQGAPHYLIWAPDGSHLAFIGNSNRGLTLYLDDLADDVGPLPTLDRGPLYLDWSPDSRHLLVHRDLKHLIVDAEDGRASEIPIDSQGIGYRAPAWRPVEDEITFVSSDTYGRYWLYTADVDAKGQTLVGTVPSGAAFMWSADGEFLAVTDPERVLTYRPLQLLVYQRVSLFKDGTRRHPTEIKDDVVAFFWSPDSTKLAYVTLTRVPGTMRWNILSVADGERWPLVDFVPSLDQVTVFQFFDQYARSHTLWSPDSKSLVFAGRVAGGSLSASFGQQPASSIIVIGTERRPTVDAIASGTLGLWSPR